MTIIGDFLDSLNDEQGNRLLTGPFAPLYSAARVRSGLPPYRTAPCQCMVMAVRGLDTWELGSPFKIPGFRYEELCTRFGATRINAAIRNRILSNRARHILSVPSYVEIM